MATTTKTTSTLPCPACGHGRGHRVAGPGELYRCARCRCLHGSAYLGDSYAHVLPRMKAAPADLDGEPYDIMALGSEGLQRRHGWYDPADKLIIQVG